MKSHDLTGQIFGNWKVLKRDTTKKNGRSNWLCECQCENKTQRIVDGYSLTSGRSTSCGCIRDMLSKERGAAAHNQKLQKRQKEKVTQTLVGNIYGELQVLSLVDMHEPSHSYYKCKCLRCGNEKIIRGSSLTTGHTTSCGCIRSIGETIITKLLEENNISFIKEKTFDNCLLPTGGKARFDFFVNNQYLIEYDGEQHFHSNGGWSTIENLTKVQLSDKYKNQWCKDNNILLIRIPYTHLKQLQIEDLLPTSSFAI